MNRFQVSYKILTLRKLPDFQPAMNKNNKETTYWEKFMNPLALKDANEFPTPEVLDKVLGDSYRAFEKLSAEFADFGIVPEWRYYNDGKAWLCKLMLNKKNLGWLHVYDNYFNVSCFFTEKHFEAIEKLDVANEIKEEFYHSKTTGKLIPMAIRITDNKLPEDVMKMIAFKKNLK